MHNLREEFNAAVLEKDELEYQELSMLRALLRLQVNQDCNLKSGEYFMLGRVEYSALSENPSTDSSIEKKKQVEWRNMSLNFDAGQN